MNIKDQADLFSYLDMEFLFKLRNLEKNNPVKLAIFLSGRSGVGKTTLAKFLEDNLGVVRISNDELRNKIIEYGYTGRESINSAMWNYQWKVLDFIKNRSKNKAFVRDALVDRFWREYFSWADDSGYSKFIISFQIEDSLNDKVILQRGDHKHISVPDLLELKPRQIAWREDFLKNNTPDVIINDYSSDQYKNIVNLIRNKLNES